MRQTIITIIILLFALTMSNVYAKTPKKIKSDFTNQKIELYAKPTNKAEVLDKITLRHPLIPFYRQGDWIKVGNPENGKAGWINAKRYYKLKKQLMHPSIQSVVITVTDEPNENGKPKILAYKNGKQLSDQEAKHILKRFHKRQMRMEKHFERMQQHMDQIFNAMWTWDPDSFDNKNTPMPQMHRLNP